MQLKPTSRHTPSSLMQIRALSLFAGEFPGELAVDPWPVRSLQAFEQGRPLSGTEFAHQLLSIGSGQQRLLHRPVPACAD
mmetsp:Transcript_44148/g.75128  ORF Transcript_44148/g.75128 Transcript_44148/m.75128 type:complete len:80 (+) Transcript_44148:212-451(+)